MQVGTGIRGGAAFGSTAANVKWLSEGQNERFLRKGRRLLDSGSKNE